ATVTVAGNRCVRQDEGGIILGGAAGLALLDLGANSLAVAPIQRAYDRSNLADARNLPDTLTALVIGNDLSDNLHFGVRLWGYPPAKYSTTDGVLTSVLHATLIGNSFLRNGDHGVWVDGGWPERGLPS